MSWTRVSPAINQNTTFNPQLYTDLQGVAIEDEENEGLLWVVDVFNLGPAIEWGLVSPAVSSNWTQIQP